MKEITLTINGKQVKGKEGETVLEICQANSIDLPTLCHLQELSDVGACRMCVVEIEKERRPVPACTYPAREGLVVLTATPRLEKYRRQLLELIFTEHNHFCMFCEASGDCELQKLAYRYQMDNVRYPYAFPQLPVDAISDYLVIDHNRCILCGRCIRTCNEIAASNTLNFSQRGWKTAISADIEQPLGESQCFSCGSCLQACPTGAIFSKFSIYKGKREECQEVKTNCQTCGLGCGLNVLVKDNNLVKIEADNPRGIICRLGRFEPLRENRKRITSPMVRGSQGKLENVSLKKAVEVAAEKIAAAKGDFAGVAATRFPNETLATFSKFMTDVAGSRWLDTLDGDTYRAIEKGISGFSGKNGNGLGLECSVDEIMKADCVLVVGADPEDTHPVIASQVRRAARQKGTKIIVIDPEKDVFPLWTDLWLKPKAGSEETLLKGLAKVLIDSRLVKAGDNSKLVKSFAAGDMDGVLRETGVGLDDIELAAAMFGQTGNAVIIYGEGLFNNNSPAAVTALLNLAELSGNRDGDKLRVMSLKRRANSRGAWEMGLAVKGLKQDKPKGLYLLLGEEEVNEELLDSLRGIGFLAVQASYESAATALADVVLPSTTWAEREGTVVTTDGEEIKVRHALELGNGSSDTAVMSDIAKRLGKNLTSNREAKVG